MKKDTPKLIPRLGSITIVDTGANAMPLDQTAFAPGDRTPEEYHAWLQQAYKTPIPSWQHGRPPEMTPDAKANEAFRWYVELVLNGCDVVFYTTQADHGAVVKTAMEKTVNAKLGRKHYETTQLRRTNEIDDSQKDELATAVNAAETRTDTTRRQSRSTGVSAPQVQAVFAAE